VVWGGTRNPARAPLVDLDLREMLTMAPLLFFVFWIGLHPEPLMRVMKVSVRHVIEQTHPAVRGPAAANTSPKIGLSIEGGAIAPRPSGLVPTPPMPL
jgi:NADH-quinone oxidoreductase subunit M